MAGFIQKRQRNGSTTYKVRYRDPSGRERSKTFPNRDMADRFLSTVTADVVRGDWVEPTLAGKSVHSYGEAWIRVKRGQVKRSTADAYEADLHRYVFPQLGRVPVSRLSPQMIDEWIADLRHAGASPAKVRNVLVKVLRPVLNHAVRDGAIKANPSAPIRLSKPRRKRDIKVINAAQVKALVDALPAPYDTLVLFTAYTGFSWGEVAGLRRRRLDLMRGRVEVAEVLTEHRGQLGFDGPKTPNRERTITLPPFLVNVMVEYVAERGVTDPDALVFTTPRGRPLRSPNFLQKVYIPAVEAALPDDLHGFRFHDLRHTHVALLIEQGAHPKEISVRLGHSSIMITMDTYGHLLPSLDEQLTSGLDAAYRASKPTADGTVVPLRPDS